MPTMPRCSRRNSRLAPPCTCLVDAFRNLPNTTDFGEGCASPACPVKSLDSVTLQQFLEAIGGRDCTGGEEAGADEDQDFRLADLASRRSRRTASGGAER